MGGTAEKRVDVRILAATNADLQTKISEGGFREDLYFRLAAFTVSVPPLRERPADIPLLVNHFLKMFATEMAIETPVLTDEAISALIDYTFPGNIRELKNIIERALIESGGSEIQSKHLHFLTARILANSATVEDKSSLEIPLNLQQAEVFLIKRVLMQVNGNISETARLLGIIKPSTESSHKREWSLNRWRKTASPARREYSNSQSSSQR